MISDAVMRDEDFVEVHLNHQIHHWDIEEVRLPPEDVARETQLREHCRRGQMPSPTEGLWFLRRANVERELTKAEVIQRVVSTVARGGRWK
jgi:hypothetical protein